jgi:hypothetical protein
MTGRELVLSPWLKEIQGASDLIPMPAAASDQYDEASSALSGKTPVARNQGGRSSKGWRL